MAKDISLLGADYPDVPAVTLPQTGGGTATFIEESELGNTHVWVGTCDTAAATRDKAVTITGVTQYRTGDIFVITFTNAQDYNGAPRLNVNGLGVKTIRRTPTTSAVRYQWVAGETQVLVYNGTDMLLVNNGIATTTYYGLTKLSNNPATVSSSIAATVTAVNRGMEIITAMPVYDATLTYSIGDRVRYSLGMYECSDDISTPEAWNAEHWTELPALQTQIDTLKTEVDGTAKLKYMDVTDTTPMNLNTQTGNVVTRNNFVGCCARTAGLLPMPYYNNGVLYIKLCNYSDLSPFSGSGTVRVWYV